MDFGSVEEQLTFLTRSREFLIGCMFFFFFLNSSACNTSIAETGNEQHYRIITSDRILLHEIDRYYDYWRLLKIKHALAAICW